MSHRNAPLASYTPKDVAYDYALGGLPFLSAASPDAPLQRRTTAFQREQFDQDREAGENSLTGYWLRSQSSFHGGAGQQFLDGGEDNPLRRARFLLSRGMCTTTPGKAYPLPLLAQKIAGDFSPGMIVSHINGIMAVRLNAGVHELYNYGWTNDGAVTATLVVEASRPAASSLVENGTDYFLSRSNGVWKNGLQFTDQPTQLYSTTLGLLLGWVKDRLMAANGRTLWELSITGAAGAALPTPFYTHPTPKWKWNNWAEGPKGIYVGGFVEGGSPQSGVYFVALDTTGATPVLDAPARVLELPKGENLKDNGMYAYLGRFLVLCTTAGIRVAIIEADGSLSVGPVMFDPRLHLDRSSYNVGGIAGRDGHVYISVNGSSLWAKDHLGVLCLDLGVEVEPGVYAWSAAWTADTAVTSVPKGLVFDHTGRPCIPTSGGIYRPWMTYGTVGQHNIVTSGIRFSTAEDKTFESIRVQIDRAVAIYNNALRVYFFKDELDGNREYMPGNANILVTGGEDSIEYRLDDTWYWKKGQYVRVQFEWRPDSVDPYTDSPYLEQYQLRALPAPKRMRTEVLPLMMFDYETDRAGNLVGSDGSAWTRLKALEDLESNGRTIKLQRFGSQFGTANDEIVVIDSVEFMQMTPPANRGSGFGGQVNVTIRRVA